ncbi:MAG: DUF4433 domain-containing protein [Cyclobacteriaceae bacterium]
MSIPERKYIYRIIHVDNLDYILSSGKLTSPVHREANPNYVGIGDNSLKDSRRSKQIEIKPHGTFSEYVAFYFGYRSPMLYNIKNGYLDVTKRPQEELIYIVSSVDRVIELDLDFVFYDGHGYHNFSQAFNDIKFLDRIDWQIINAGQWYDTEDDPDRKRRKQAEFLIKDELALDAILGIAAYNIEASENVNNILRDHFIDIKTVAMPSWYY